MSHGIDSLNFIDVAVISSVDEFLLDDPTVLPCRVR